MTVEDDNRRTATRLKAARHAAGGWTHDCRCGRTWVALDGELCLCGRRALQPHRARCNACGGDWWALDHERCPNSRCPSQPGPAARVVGLAVRDGFGPDWRHDLANILERAVSAGWDRDAASTVIRDEFRKARCGG
jgi:hypothetical protein